MPFCANCGSQVDGRFCPKCGAAVAGGAGPAAPPQSAPNPGGAPYAAATSVGLTDNVASALCYLPLPVVGLIVGILFLVLAPYNQNPKIRFHAFQSIFIHVAAFVVYVAWSLVSLVSGGWLFFLSPVLWLGFFVLWLVMMIKTFQDQKLVLPVIGPLAEKQAGS